MKKIIKVSLLILIALFVANFFVVIEKVQADFVERQITDDSDYQFSPTIYGDKIVWQDNRNGNWDIYMYDLTEETEIQITTNSSNQNSPSIYDDKIVWIDLRNGNRDIYMYDLTEETEIQITTDPNDQYDPAIYGDKIVWWDVRNGDQDIYMYDLTEETEIQITTNSSNQNSPSIYDDKIVWQDNRNGNWDIYMYDLTEETEIQITTDLNTQYSPGIYEDKIVWYDGRNFGNWDIYMYDLTEETEIQITTDPNDQSGPAIYGDKIVWDDNRNDITRDGYTDIYMYDLTEETEIQITTNPETQRFPSIYEDKIVWEDVRDGFHDIYMAIPISPRYWIGNGGNWNDASHWSLTSGGTGGAPVPDEYTNVIFDENSITAEDQVITFPTDQISYMYNWDMTNLAYPITMDSTNGTDYWELSVAEGTVETKDTTLINSHALGGATFNAFTSNGNVDGGGNEGWDFSDPTLRYWIGNGGNWNDTSHWSLTSGGIGGAEVPSETTNVIFDENSFTQAGQSILFPPALAEDPQLTLNFTGTDGATTWTDEAQGLEPEGVMGPEPFGVEIDSNTLKMDGFDEMMGPSGFLYSLPTALESDFNLSFDFSFDPIVNSPFEMYPGVGTMIRDDDGDAMVSMSLIAQGPILDKYLNFTIIDREGTIIYEDATPTSLSANTFHNVELEVVGRDIIINLNGSPVGTFEADIDNPLAGIDAVAFINGLAETAWMDNVNLTTPSSYQASSNSWDMTNLAYPITMDSTNGTDYWELSVAEGTVETKDTTLINSHALGGATFNAFTSNGNVDGGGNEGWDFGEESEENEGEDEEEGGGVPISLTNITDITKDSVKLHIELDQNYVNQTLDFDVRIKNKDNNEKDHEHFTKTVDSDGRVSLIIEDLDSDTDYDFKVKFYPYVESEEEPEPEIDDGCIEIQSAEDLDDIRDDLTACYVQTTDIDMSDYEGFEPIGMPENFFGGESPSDIEPNQIFQGSYDGGGYFITGLNTAIFGAIGEEAIVRNVNMSEIVIDGDSYFMDYEISNMDVGGISFINLGTISRCSLFGRVENGDEEMMSFLGIVVGFNQGLIEECSVEIETINEYKGVNSGAMGGLVLYNIGPSPDGFSPDVNGEIGIVRKSFAIQEGYFELEELPEMFFPGGFGYPVAGLVAANLGGLVEDCHLEFDIESDPDALDIGSAIVGINMTQDENTGVHNSYSFGNFSSGGATALHTVTLAVNLFEDFYAGVELDHEEIFNSYYSSETGANPPLDYVAIEAGFEDWAEMKTSIPPEAVEYYETNVLALFGQPKTNEQLKNQATFEDWDFDNIWYIEEGEDCPRLLWTLEDPEQSVVEVFYSDYSNSKSATTEDDIEDDCTPTKLKATAISPSQINLKWNDNCQVEKGYLIERKTENGYFETIFDLEKNKEDYQDNNLSIDTKYTYRVKAYKGDRFSDYSNEAEITTLGATTISPIEDEIKDEYEEYWPPEEEEEETEETPPVTQITEPDQNLNEPSTYKKVTGALKSFGLLTGTIVSLASTPAPLFGASPTPFSNNPISKPFSLFGFLGRAKRKRRDLGFIFDEETKKPIPGAIVTIFNKKGDKIDSIITDYLGRYGFLATEGDYTIEVYKKGYKLKTDNLRDEFYGDLYTGGVFKIRENNIIETNISMEATSNDWKTIIKRKFFASLAFLSVFSKNFFVIIFYLGFLVAISNLLFFPPTLIDKLIVTLYALVAAYQIFFKGKSFGTITNKNGKPIPFSVISLYDKSDLTRRVAFTVSNLKGQYYLTVKDGYYIMKIQGKELKGKAFTETLEVYAKKGIVKKNFVID